MADFTASVLTARNTSTTLAFNGSLVAAQTVNYDEIADEKVLIIAQNTNTAANMTATIAISAGDYLQSVQGTLSIDVAGNNAYVAIGPLEGARFKNSASKVSILTTVTQSGTVSYVKFAVLKTH